MKTWGAAFLSLAVCFGAALPVCRAQQQPGPEGIVLAENDGLKALLRVKTPANLAEADWLQIEILNSGRRVESRQQTCRDHQSAGRQPSVQTTSME
jgi:hypothetical protein